MFVLHFTIFFYIFSIHSAYPIRSSIAYTSVSVHALVMFSALECVAIFMHILLYACIYTYASIIWAGNVHEQLNSNINFLKFFIVLQSSTYSATYACKEFLHTSTLLISSMGRCIRAYLRTCADVWNLLPCRHLP